MGAANRMVVEGQEDKYAVIALMGHHIMWPLDIDKAPVRIELGGGASDILATGFISGKLKESGVDILGVVLDADIDFDARWKRISHLCSNIFPTMPAKMPSEGLIMGNDDGMRLGVWIMPDNASQGMLETFLRYLVPDVSVPLMAYANEVVAIARRDCGSPCRECHIDKAIVHTWLAWQDPPGQPLGRALSAKILDPYRESAQPFVAWFKALYAL
jgi:hypothetical protein